MTSHHRYLGVARPPGVDPNPPRLVVDLSGTRAPAAPIPTPAAGPKPLVATARPRQDAGPAEHRRQLRRAVVRRWEVAVWSAAGAVVLAMVAFLLVNAPRATVSAGAVSAGVVSAGVVSVAASAGAAAATVAARSPAAAPPASASGAPCIVSSCGRPPLTGSPTALRIPALTVTTPLESLVLDDSGKLLPPTDYAKAGWWTQGVVPGDVGPAVIAGHVDSVKSGPAVFYHLHKLIAGDTVEVDRGGETVAFMVTAVEQYPKNAFPTDRVYRPTPDAELRLITCGGEFDRTRLSYRDNIVVYAIRR